MFNHGKDHRTNLRIEEPLWLGLVKYSNKYRMSITALVNLYIEMALDQEEEDEKIISAARLRSRDS